MSATTAQDNIFVIEDAGTIESVNTIQADPTSLLDPITLPGAGLPPSSVPELMACPTSDPILAPAPFTSNVPPVLPISDPAIIPTNTLIPPSEDDSVSPLVFEPVLAGPMMVAPPAEQNGVIFAPKYADLI